MSDWQPIEDAPKNASILGWWPTIKRGNRYGAVIETRWTGKRWWRPKKHDAEQGPTHFMPFSPPTGIDPNPVA